MRQCTCVWRASSWYHCSLCFIPIFWYVEIKKLLHRVLTKEFKVVLHQRSTCTRILWHVKFNPIGTTEFWCCNRDDTIAGKFDLRFPFRFLWKCLINYVKPIDASILRYLKERGMSLAKFYDVITYCIITELYILVLTLEWARHCHDELYITWCLYTK